MNPLSANAAAHCWVASGDYELNFAGLCGAPTLRPSPALEHILRLPRLQQGSNGDFPPLELGVHLHAFHVPECQRILDQLCESLPSCDLLITTDSHTKQTAIEDQLSRCSSPPWQKRLEVRVVPNRGRNVVPLLRDGLDFLDPCELALHLHTKRTDHKSFGGSWFAELLNALVGDSIRVGSAIEAFASHPDLGLAMPQAGELIRPYLNWGANFDIAAVLVQSLWPGRQLSIQAPLVFPQGMMFWFRPQALKPLSGAMALLEPLPLEPLLHDGTPLHALERLTAHACEVAGLRWALLPADDDPGNPSTKPWPKNLSVWDPQPEAYLAGVAALAEHHRQLKSKLAEREAAFADLNKHRKSLKENLLERDVALATATAATATAAAAATATVQELEAELQGLRQSLSWRLTGPLRRAKRLLQ